MVFIANQSVSKVFSFFFTKQQSKVSNMRFILKKN